MQKSFSVGQINAYIKDMFLQNVLLSRVSIAGEVSNCKYHTSGHIYFSLKDDTGTLSCIMFASQALRLKFRLANGQQVAADGSIGVYERDGKYQLYVSRITPAGAGLLYERFLALKQELEEMGMFAPEYKRTIPFYVKKLGVVTAPTGAAIRDIISISRRRNPGIQLILYPAKVQGEGAAQSIAAGLRALDALGLDAIIVGRGGGSMEDLWAFNEEIVAHAIFACKTPVISAVGHETDTTIADYAADLRAPTPSAAAELATLDVRGLLEQLENYGRQLEYQMRSRLEEKRGRLEDCTRRLRLLSPQNRILQQKQRSADLEEAFAQNMQEILRRKRWQLAMYAERLKGLSPLEKLSQGYAVVLDKDGRRVHSAAQVCRGDHLQLYVRDGKIDVSVL